MAVFGGALRTATGNAECAYVCGEHSHEQLDRSPDYVYFHWRLRCQVRANIGPRCENRSWNGKWANVVACPPKSTHNVLFRAAKVGPGDYNINASRGVVPAAVPFHTSREKTLCDNNTTSAVTPGVGSYESSQALDALKLKHVAPTGPTANFVSTGPRLHVDKSTGIAGPGCVVGSMGSCSDAGMQPMPRMHTASVAWG